jgi:hypothetical protein
MDIVASCLVRIGTKLITETFLAKLLVHTLRAWARTSETAWDDKVVEAVAEALCVEVETLKK